MGEEWFADEGRDGRPTGSGTWRAMGLGRVGPFSLEHEWVDHAMAVLGEIPLVCGNTVSTCSGTDSAFRASSPGGRGLWSRRWRGLSVAAVCEEHDVPLLQLRCVANFTGDRDERRVPHRGGGGEGAAGCGDRVARGVVPGVAGELRPSPLRVGFSPCPNDTFMFHGLVAR